VRRDDSRDPIRAREQVDKWALSRFVEGETGGPALLEEATPREPPTSRFTETPRRSRSPDRRILSSVANGSTF
jgi:hypothetical protein